MRDKLKQALIKRHGADLQERFSSATVAVCGLGGLGSNVAIALARAGIGRLLLFDFDRVDISNLNRQQYAVAQLGMHKTDALRDILAAVAPLCEVTASAERLDESSIAEHLSAADIVCECFDAPECKAELVNTVSEHFPDKFIVCASGMAGLHSSNTIRTKRLTKRLYICGDGRSDVQAEGTLFAPRVMLCAAHQANTVLRIIAEKYEP